MLLSKWTFSSSEYSPEEGAGGEKSRGYMGCIRASVLGRLKLCTAGILHKEVTYVLRYAVCDLRSWSSIPHLRG